MLWAFRTTGADMQSARELSYISSTPPLEVTFKIAGGHYSGMVTGGNLFLQTDIPEAPLVRFKSAKKEKLYTLMMIDFDGNAHGSWPDKVAPGKNSPVRHWLVGNIPGPVLSGPGYRESGIDADLPVDKGEPTVLQAYRAPHIPVVSDRYALYLFEQDQHLDFVPVPEPITNFDHKSFLQNNHLGAPVASNWFVAIYTSASPFSGQAFHGNDVSGIWHDDLGKGSLGREE
jgi:phosphatidylethanolamine-binding protein (PEBP) family uncharacterized protein